jgi:hypothetical protein
MSNEIQLTITEIERTDEPKFIPKKVFIVPYRNRIQHKFFFSKYMSFILEDTTDYEIYFCHQCDSRTFNRGATKNIGFLAMKNKYPNHYKNMTFIFNDVDTIPFNKIFDYDTKISVVKHYYGFKYALGGIVAIKGSDFERINGFPCFWGWGMEDNVLQKRCLAANIFIDRSVFYNIGSPEILQLFDGISRIISKKDPERGESDDGYDGLQTMSQLQYTIDTTSANPQDNIFFVHNSNIHYINISHFLTRVPFGAEEYYTYDLREPKKKLINPDRLKETKKTIVTPNDWTNIPYYPTLKEKREKLAKQIVNSGKPIPPSLLLRLQQDKIDEIKEDVYNVSAEHNVRAQHNVSAEHNLNNSRSLNNVNTVVPSFLPPPPPSPQPQTQSPLHNPLHTPFQKQHQFNNLNQRTILNKHSTVSAYPPQQHLHVNRSRVRPQGGTRIGLGGSF